MLLSAEIMSSKKEGQFSGVKFKFDMVSLRFLLYNIKENGRVPAIEFIHKSETLLF
jgi:hypothetical protein